MATLEKVSNGYRLSQSDTAKVYQYAGGLPPVITMSIPISQFSQPQYQPQYQPAPQPTSQLSQAQLTALLQAYQASQNQPAQGQLTAAQQAQLALQQQQQQQQFQLQQQALQAQIAAQQAQANTPAWLQVLQGLSTPGGQALLNTGLNLTGNVLNAAGTGISSAWNWFNPTPTPTPVDTYNSWGGIPFLPVSNVANPFLSSGNIGSGIASLGDFGFLNGQ